MKIKIQSIHFDADKKLLDFVEEKVGKLKHYNSSIIESEVFLRLDKSSDLENKVAEIKSHVSGTDLFAKKHAESFESAIDKAFEAVLVQIKKHKETHG